MNRDPLDRLLDQWQPGQPSPELAGRIVARSRELSQQGAWSGWTARLAGLLTGSSGGTGLAPQLAGLGVALLIGFWYGAGGGGSTVQEIDASPLILGPSLEAEWLG